MAIPVATLPDGRILMSDGTKVNKKSPRANPNYKAPVAISKPAPVTTPKFNLFDFSGVKSTTPNIGKTISSPIPTQMQSIPTKPTIQAPQKTGGISDWLGVPQAKANEGNVIQSFLDDSKNKAELSSKRNAVIEMLKNQEEDSFIEDAIINKMKWSPKQPIKKPQSFIEGMGEQAKGIAEKTGESFMGGVERVKKGFADKNFLEGVGEATAGVLQSVTSPIAGVVGQGIETLVAKPVKTAYKAWMPQNIQDELAKGTTEGIKTVSDWYQAQPEGVKRTLKNIGLVAELGSYAIGGVGAKKALPVIGEGLLKGGQVLERGVVGGGKKIIKVPGKIGEGTISLLKKETRPVKDIAGNILQPYKGMTENLDDATRGIQRVVSETGTKTSTFDDLLENIKKTQNKYGKIKEESLSQIKQTKKSVSAQTALDNLENVYIDVSSSKLKSVQSRIRELSKKNFKEGLTPLEMDEVKILHTKSNNLFNQKGQQTGGFSSDDLRGVREDLKNEIEDFAKANGVTNIKEINKVYGELSDAKTLAENQVANLTSYKGRQIPPTRLQKVADFIMEFPVIKQVFSDPARIFASSLFKTLRGDKINPIEVQKRLPGFLKELQNAGMKSGDLQKVEKMIQNEMKLLPAPSGLKPSAIISNVKPIISPKIGQLEKTSTAISGKIGKRPGTTFKEGPIRQGPQTNKPKLINPPKNANSNNNMTIFTNNRTKIVKPPLNKSETTKKLFGKEGIIGNNKGFINPKAIGKDLGLIKKPILDINPEGKTLIEKYTNSGGGTSKPMPIQEQNVLSKEIVKLPKNKETVYSGLKLSTDDVYNLRNDEWTTKRVLSSSTDKKTAQEFADYNPEMKNKVILTIKGGGHNIDKYSAFQNQKMFNNENEVLFPIGQKFKVKQLGDLEFELTPIYEQANKPSLKSLTTNTRGSAVMPTSGLIKKPVSPKNKERILYHGTNKEFNNFDINSFGKGGGNYIGNGIYLTDNPKIAGQYADSLSQKGGIKNVIKTSIKGKILDFDGKMDNSILENFKGVLTESYYNRLKKLDTSKIFNDFKQFYNTTLGGGGLNKDFSLEDRISGKAKDFINKELQKNGYSGIKFSPDNLDVTKGEKGSNYLLFDTKNVKIIPKK